MSEFDPNKENSELSDEDLESVAGGASRKTGGSSGGGGGGGGKDDGSTDGSTQVDGDAAIDTILNL